MSKSSRYWLRLTSAFVNRFKLLFLVGIGAGLIGFFALTYIVPQFALNSQKIGVVGEYTIYQSQEADKLCIRRRHQFALNSKKIGVVGEYTIYQLPDSVL